MRTTNTRTHRPLALVAFFALLGAIGWQLPSLGRAALAYSNHAVTTARAAITSATESKVYSPQVANAATATARAAVAADTPGQQALTAARAALDAAVAAARSNPQGKTSEQNINTAHANLNAAITLRLSEISTSLNQLAVNRLAGSNKNDSGPAGGPSADYNSLVAELNLLGGFPNSVNAPAPNQINETEPNNTSATANTLNVASVATAVGSVSPAEDLDFFKFTAPANSKVWIYVDTGGTLVAGTRDSFVDLLGTDGTTVIEGDDDDGTSNGGDGTVETGFGSAIAGRAIATAGDYFIRVRGFGTFPGTNVVNPYVLFVVVTTAATATVAETEPNDTAATATALLSGSTTTAIATGSVASGATDFYSVTANAGDILYVNLDGDPERDGTGTDGELSLRDSAGALIGSLISDSINLGTAANPPAENFSFLFTTSGTFTLRVFGFGGQGSYNLMASMVTPAATQVCPPVPITSSLGIAGGNFPKVSGTQTQRLFRDGVASACGVARTQAAPIAGTFTFDKYTFTNSSLTTKCITVQLNVLETAASNYMVGAFSAFDPTNLISGWLGDPGLSSGIPPSQQSFSVNISAGAKFDIVVFNTNATGNGNPYALNVFGFDSCVVPACGITCPANITVSNAANQCGATVTYPAPTTTGLCTSVTCTPASGTFFPKGTTTVTCTGASPGNPNSTCSFTVTVNDTQPPTMTCPSNQFVGTTGTTAVVNYPAPTVSDNCPGVQAAVCTPASGTAFPVGVTTVTCSTKDASNNSASCSFAVTVNKETPPTLTDTLACTGPGNVLNASFALSNNGNVSQTVTATASMPVAGGVPQLLALPGSCTASIGSCTVVNGTTVSYSGSVPAGQTVTIRYQVQVNDIVQNGTTMTITTLASWNGGPALTVGTNLTTNCTSIGPGLPIPTAVPSSDQKAGSVLVYPIYTSSVGQNSQNSRISITNVNPSLKAYLHLYFVADNCAVSDAFLCLTPNQTTTFLASDMDPGTTGYLVAMAVDGTTGCPVNFNFLIGDEYVKFSSGHAANLGAEAIPAIAGSAAWSSTFCSAAANVLATVRFDGVTYAQLPTTVAVDNVGSRADGNDMMLILNGFGGDLRTGPNTLGSIFGVLYDDSEAAYSFSIAAAACQFRTSLNNNTPRTTPRFDQVIPAGRSGWIRMWHRFGAPVLGATINFNANAAASSGAFNQGHNLHKLTTTDTGVITVPVFPPTC